MSFPAVKKSPLSELSRQGKIFGAWTFSVISHALKDVQTAIFRKNLSSVAVLYTELGHLLQSQVLFLWLF